MINSRLFGVLTILDGLIPAQRLEFLCRVAPRDSDSSNERLRICELAMLALAEIDHAIRGFCVRETSLYVQDDDSLINLLNVIPSAQCGLHAKDALLRLSQSQLIYRFNVAAKFDVPAVKQLRINGWGYQYIKDKQLMHRHRQELDLLRTAIGRYFHQHKDQVTCLVQLFGERIDPTIAQSIKRANHTLAIKLLC